MSRFTFNTTKSIRFGSGAIEDLGNLARDLLQNTNKGRVLLVTDQGLVSTGIVARAIQHLEDAGLVTAVFNEVEADPSENIIMNAAEMAVSANAGAVIGIGGGSSLDVAKLVALLASNTNSADHAEMLKKAYGVGNAKGPRLPLVLVPTTAGTGSEVTPISIVTTGTNEKMGVVSPVILPDLALLDPDLTLGLPAHITAATGIDAMVHAIEAYASASPNNNPMSRHLAINALQLMGGSLLTAVHHGQDLQARTNVMLGSMLAGQAFANSPVAAVHALAYPLGGHFHIPHGLSNALVLPHVLRFNIATHPQAYSEMAVFAFPDLVKFEEQERAAAFCEKLAQLAADCGLQQNLRQMGIGMEILPRLASDAMNQTRLLVNNPRLVTEKDALAIYQAAY